MAYITERDLTDDDKRTAQDWIRGIERGTWEPTAATKRHVAQVLRALLAAVERDTETET